MTAERDLRPFLEAVHARFHTPEHAHQDPVRFPRSFADRADREVAGFVAAAMAFGRVAGFTRVLDALFARLGPHPAAEIAAMDVAACRRTAAGLIHRFVGPEQIAGLLVGLGGLVRADGGLEPAFQRGFRTSGDIVDGLASLAGALRQSQPSPGFLVSAVGPQNPAKRLNLFLRWMVRADDLDLGLWRDVPAKALLVPLDVHVFRIAQLIGLLPPRRSGPRLADARTLTAALARLDPDDPVRFDFALSHLGISGECLGRFRPEVCGHCGLRSACRVAISSP